MLAKTEHALVHVGAAAQKTPTPRIQGQPVAVANRLPALSVHRLGIFEIAQTPTSICSSAAEADDVMTQNRTSSLAFVPASMWFVSKATLIKHLRKGPALVRRRRMESKILLRKRE